MNNFVVSALKYRPTSFDTVMGQEHITATLRNAIARNQLAHAYLFCGPRGVGKTTCARIFAKTINCLSPSDGSPCESCESCVAFNKGRSFNIHELDAASNNGVDEMRQLTEQVRVMPAIGSYNVYIIDEVHMLSQGAFNAFLKTLEEPPAHVIFILATTEKHKIIPTILSRCQVFDFNRIRVEDGVEYLRHIADKEGIEYDEESLHMIAQKADGGMRDALSMFDKAVSFSGGNLKLKEVARALNVLDFDTYFELISLIRKGAYPPVLKLFDEVVNSGFSIQNFLTGFNSHLRDLLMCKDQTTSSILELSGALLARYKEQAEGCSVEFLFGAISLMTAIDSDLRMASNRRLNVELGLMKLCGMDQKKKSDATLNELGDEFSLPKLIKGEADSIETAQNISTTPSQVGVERIQAEVAKDPIRSSTPEASEVPETLLKTAPEVREVPEILSETLLETTPSAEAGNILKRIVAPPAKTTPEQGFGRPISGRLISDLISSVPVSAAESDGELPVDEEPVEVDLSGVMQHREDFIEILKRSRRRIAMAFHEMRVEDNALIVPVPSQDLFEEIMRNRTEILELLIEVSGLDGVPIFRVEIVEETGALRPIKFEDKYEYLSKKNPDFKLLCKSLNLVE